MLFSVKRISEIGFFQEIEEPQAIQSKYGNPFQKFCTEEEYVPCISRPSFFQRNGSDSSVRQTVVPTATIFFCSFFILAIVSNMLFSISIVSACIWYSRISGVSIPLNVPSPTWSVIYCFSFGIFSRSSRVKWSDAVGAATEPFFFAKAVW